MADVLIQAQHKSYVPRIVEYFENFVWNFGSDDGPHRALFAFREESLISPSRAASSSTTSTSSSSSLRGRLGTSTLELSRGARGGRGPGLVLVRGVLCSPAEFIDWLSWWSPLPRGVARLYWLGKQRDVGGGDAEGRHNGFNGDSSVNEDSTFAGFSADTAAELASKIAAVTGNENDDDAGDEKASSLPFLLKRKRVPVRVMALPRSLESLLIDALCDDEGASGWNLDPRAGERGVGEEEGEAEEGEEALATRGLFVVAASMDGLDEESGKIENRGQHDPPIPRPRYRAAIVRPSAVLSDTTEQRSRASRPCRAEWKISEALAMSSGLLLMLSSRGGGAEKEKGDDEDEEAVATKKLLSEVLLAATTPTEKKKKEETSSNLVAVDVGAVPGGWTRHLALNLKARCVVALDPSPNLDVDVAALGNVRHVRMRSGDAGALEAVATAVGECCEGCVPEGQSPLAHLLTCDANEPPVAASEAILPLLPLLCRGALVVLTLKLRFPGRDKGFATRAAMEKLEPAGLELLADPWLFANTMYERTLLLRKR